LCGYIKVAKISDNGRRLYCNSTRYSKNKRNEYFQNNLNRDKNILKIQQGEHIKALFANIEIKIK
jgi:hypothetical protein